MSSIQSLCKVLNSKYTENDIRLSLFALAEKKQQPFIDMLYYILEDDTPLFFELFGGQILKIPTKTEFTRINNNIKIFLYIVSKRHVKEPFKLTSYKFDLYLDKIVSVFIEYYNFFIKNKKLNEIDLNLSSDDLCLLYDVYLQAESIVQLIKENPKENKRYTYKKRRHYYQEQTNVDNNDNEIDVNESNYNNLLECEQECEQQNESFEQQTNLVNNNDELNNEYINQEDDDSKQLSLFS